MKNAAYIYFTKAQIALLTISLLVWCALALVIILQLRG